MGKGYHNVHAQGAVKWCRKDRSKLSGAEVASVERNENLSNADAQSAPRHGTMVRLLIL